MRIKLAACVLLLIAAACKDNTEKEVAVPAKACFNIPAELVHGTEGTFDASCSSADSYHWYFGDGKELTDPVVKHTFLAPGRYSVSLTIYKDGKRDDAYGYVNIKGTDAETKCVPSLVRGIKIWPSPQTDSVTFQYAAGKKLSEIQWFTNKAMAYAFSAKFNYDAQGKMSVVNFYQQTNFYQSAQIRYNSNDLPARVEMSNGLSADFVHDLDGKLTSIKYMQSGTGASQTTFYEYDVYGNTTLVNYSGAAVVNSGAARENTAFDNALTFYSGSKELKFFFEYVVGIEPYVNSLKWSTVKENRGGPGWQFEYHSYTDRDMNNPPGIDREYAIKLDPNTKLPVGLAPNTKDVVLTDLTYSKVVYNCDL